MNQAVTGNSIYLAYVDEYLRELGEDSDFVFKAAGLENKEIISSGGRIPMDVMARVYGRVYDNPRLAGFFAHLGARIPLTAHGNLGLALLVSPDIRAVLDLLQRFTALAIPIVRIQLEEDSKQASIHIEVFASCASFKAALLESVATHLVTCLASLTSPDMLPTGIEFEHAAPKHAAQFSAFSRGPVIFRSHKTRIVFSLQALGMPVRTANRLNQNVVVQQCVKELEQVQRHSRHTDRVREILIQSLGMQTSICEVARKLSISERSLRRRLEEEGQSFRDLLKQVRHEMARHYLRDSTMKIEQIAKQLGYTETASFSQAFRVMAGKSPRAWRSNPDSD